jgi:GT2 family glycosyltransferase
LPLAAPGAGRQNRSRRLRRPRSHGPQQRASDDIDDPERTVPILLFTTRDGMSTLPRMLERVARIRWPAGLRIVAVDNGSTDGSGDLLRAWTARLPMEVLECPLRGKNRALNHALDHIGSAALAAAELVVVTDDDIVPREDWLVRLLLAARSEPRADMFGGVIEPRWPHTPPDWLMAMDGNFPILFAATTRRHGPCSSRDIYGPNMAVRGRVFAAGARFEPSIGPDGTRRYGMGSESEFLRRLERAGHRSFFCGYAVVGHQVEPAQMTQGSVIARARRYGYGLAMMDAQARGRLPLAVAALRRFAEREVKALAAMLPFWSSRRLATRFEREVRRGYLDGLLRAPALPATPMRPARTPMAAPRIRGYAAAAPLQAAPITVTAMPARDARVARR